jgi:hypothetical protein
VAWTFKWLRWRAEARNMPNSKSRLEAEEVIRGLDHLATAETDLAAARAQRDQAVGLLRPYAGCSRMRSGDIEDTWNCGECQGCQIRDLLASLAPGTEPTETTKEPK